MRFYGKAREVGTQLIAAFREGRVPAALAPIFIQRTECHCSRWSWTNRLIVALHGYTDARSYKGWQQVGRQVRKGEKGFFILEPVKVRITEEEEVETEDGEAGAERVRFILVGFKVGVRFGLEQTEGDPLPIQAEQDHAQRFIDALPLVEVAHAWGLQVRTSPGGQYSPKGTFHFDPVQKKGIGIILRVENVSTWAHELVHAADLRLGYLATEAAQPGQSWAASVAELGGCVLLHLLGRPEEADDGGAWQYIQHYARAADIEPLTACLRMLERTCEAVSLILSTAGLPALSAGKDVDLPAPNAWQAGGEAEQFTGRSDYEDESDHAGVDHPTGAEARSGSDPTA